MFLNATIIWDSFYDIFQGILSLMLQAIEGQITNFVSVLVGVCTFIFIGYFTNVPSLYEVFR